jgi:hypothetical protein
MTTLQYYFYEGSHVIFNNYIIDNGVIINKETGNIVRYSKYAKKYNTCKVQDDSGKIFSIQVGRAIASSILGPPPTLHHTADHIDRNPENDTDDNIRWATRTEQNNNQDRSETRKTAFIIIKNNVEKTAKEWANYLKGEKTPRGYDYTEKMINNYARQKQYGFSYKEYPDLPGEIWMKINNSKTWLGRWEISDMNRVKYVTNHAENILSGDRLGLQNGYPKITINGKDWKCHILAFMSFFPDEYANKKPDEIVLHEDDDRLDFRPHKLRLGTQSDNIIDAHNNGKYDGSKRARMKCVSYIDGIYEIMHNSQEDAANYLRHIGYDDASQSCIGRALNGIRKSAYDRTWKNYRFKYSFEDKSNS